MKNAFPETIGAVPPSKAVKVRLLLSILLATKKY
jgi:hypothetical protein